MGKTLLDRERELHKIGIALSSEKDIDRLLELILESAINLTDSDGGTIYRSTPEGALRLEIIRSQLLNYDYKGAQERKLEFADIELNEHSTVAIAAKKKQCINIADVYSDQHYDFTYAKEFDQQNNYRTRAILAAPMLNHDQEVIGVFQLINPKHGGAFSEEDQQLIESLASQAALVLDNLNLLNGMRDLFEAFIGVLDEAIDNMSPSTGSHEERVPILTMMLADAVNESGYHKMSSDELYELKIASLLHDCGKITTPTYILDKVKKLETLYDRIEVIITRLELRRKESEVAHLRNEIDAQTWRDQLTRIDQIEKFVKRCNQSPLSDIDQSELIALRKEGYITQEEWEYLSIPNGNLTQREREVIQHHVVVTMKMLAQLPYPKNLKRVPEIASAHHERLDGRGYPRGLSGAQISIQARILAIADVFEALSAPDRSYKTRFSLSKVINIMSEMAQNGHLDPELFAIFLQKKVYLTYANIHLAEDQIDVE